MGQARKTSVIFLQFNVLTSSLIPAHLVLPLLVAPNAVVSVRIGGVEVPHKHEVPALDNDELVALILAADVLVASSQEAVSLGGVGVGEVKERPLSRTGSGQLVEVDIETREMLRPIRSGLIHPCSHCQTTPSQGGSWRGRKR